MSNWFHRLLNPHCPECKDELRDSKVNDVAESLRMENARLTEMIDKLLDRLLEKPVEPIQEVKEPTKIKPTHIPWRVRQQMLEEQDRATARLLKEAPKPDPEITKLEVELGVSDAIPTSNEEVQERTAS